MKTELNTPTPETISSAWLDRIGAAVKEALAEYRCQHTEVDGEDGGMPLVDMLTPNYASGIELGIAEMLILEDAIMIKIMDSNQEIQGVEHCVKPTDPIHDCPACAAKIPDWWGRGYCSNCGGDLPQTTHQAEIERLRDAIMKIDDATCFDYPSMPEVSRAKSHEITREIVLRALSRQNLA